MNDCLVENAGCLGAQRHQLSPPLMTVTKAPDAIRSVRSRNNEGITCAEDSVLELPALSLAARELLSVPPATSEKLPAGTLEAEPPPLAADAPPLPLLGSWLELFPRMALQVWFGSMFCCSLNTSGHQMISNSKPRRGGKRLLQLR